MGPCQGLTLDRIDNDGNYTPSNCRWTSRSEQNKNSSRVRRIKFRGEALSVADWARRIGVKPHTISMRLNSYGWPIERALTEGARN